MSKDNDNQIYSFSAKEPSDKFTVDLLKSKCKKDGLNFSQILIKLIRSYNNEQRRTKN